MDRRITLVARDFRVLEALDWSPEPGVDLLVGPNGSGKTTVLAALKFLRALFTRGHEEALSYIRGVYLRRRGAPEHAPVHFELHVGDLHWSLDLPVDARGLRSTYGETLRRGSELILRAEMFKGRVVLRRHAACSLRSSVLCPCRLGSVRARVDAAAG